MQFEIGDKVRRTFNSCNHQGMRVGDTDVVVHVEASRVSIDLKKFGMGHASRHFELVEEKKEAPVLGYYTQRKSNLLNVPGVTPPSSIPAARLCSLEAAQQEAQRRAEDTKQPFVIMEVRAVEEYEVNVTVTKKELP